VQGPPLLLGKTGTPRPTHFKTKGKVLQSLFERGLWRYTTVKGISGHESLKGQQALVTRVPQERRNKNTEVFGHATEVGQRIALVTQMSRKHPKRRTFRARGSLASALRYRCYAENLWRVISHDRYP